MTSRLDVLVIYPSRRKLYPIYRFPPPGPVRLVPRFHRYSAIAPALLSVSVPDSTLPPPSMGSYHLRPCRRISRRRLLELHPARLRCLHLAVPVVHRCSLRQVAMPSCQSGPFLQRRPRHYSNGRERDLPGSRGTLMCACPALRPRRDGKDQADYGPSRAAFRCLENVSSHEEVISGLNHTAYTLAVYASQYRSPAYHARLASGWRPTFTGRVSHP